MRTADFVSDRAGRVIRTRRDYLAFLPAPLPPRIDYTLSIIRLLAEAERALGELAGVGRTLPNPYLLINPAIYREAVLSSRIEGTTAELEDLLIFEAEPREPPERPDVREVHNYVVALRYGLERLETLPISRRLLGEVHQRLMDGVPGHRARPGEFRTTQNWIGPPGCLLNDATYVPPPVEEMAEALSDLEKYLHGEDETPELIRVALIHYQFEAIHPFIDGNGRVGRLLIALLMRHWGLLSHPLLYLSAFFERHRREYYAGLLGVSQRGEWESWIEYFVRGVREQARDALQMARSVVDLQARYRALLVGTRLTKRTADVLDDLFANPMITVPNVHARYGGSFHTARKALQDLEDAGILRETTRRRRNRMWVAQEIVDLLAGRFTPPAASSPNPRSAP